MIFLNDCSDLKTFSPPRIESAYYILHLLFQIIKLQILWKLLLGTIFDNKLKIVLNRTRTSIFSYNLGTQKKIFILLNYFNIEKPCDWADTLGICANKKLIISETHGVQFEWSYNIFFLRIKLGVFLISPSQNNS